MKTEKKNKRVVFTMSGKGGVGKTGLMVALAKWFEAHEIPFTLLDLDAENKARGSLKHFFNGSVAKVNIHTPAGLDAFVDHLESGAAIILVDMGAGSRQVASDWFDTMYEDVAVIGARFTAVGHLILRWLSVGFRETATTRRFWFLNWNTLHVLAEIGLLGRLAI
jgi:MinD-like ATPase involved in chromosome partitioning or flagellar assembly